MIISAIRVFVAMSGGVDSSVAAYLLHKQGYKVTGVFMKNWSDPLSDICTWQEDQRDMRRVCQKIDIPYYTFSFEKQYRKKIVDYLIKGYKKGVTPNPDMLCNREIKFKLFLEKSRQMGADMIATGHHVIKKEKSGIYQLWQAKDKNKDQSYFLALLNQRQLRSSLFPIGSYTKSEVRKIAKKSKLPVYDKKDSQGICFIGKVKFKNFLKNYIKARPGLVKTTAGQVIGQHDGIAWYTIGQRHGLNIGGGTPFYVVKKEIRDNTLIVVKGEKDQALFQKELKVKNFSWIAGKPSKLPLTCRARIRYRQPFQSCVVKRKGNGLIVKFKKSQRAATPGQFIVLYQGRQMLGGGIIV